MEAITETPDLQPKWKRVLKDQGRSLSWLSMKTGVGYPTVAQWSIGARTPPAWWLDKVSELLGEDVR